MKYKKEMMKHHTKQMMYHIMMSVMKIKHHTKQMMYHIMMSLMKVKPKVKKSMNYRSQETFRIR